MATADDAKLILHLYQLRTEATMREALAQLRAAAHTAHGNYTGAMAKNLSMWS